MYIENPVYSKRDFQQNLLDVLFQEVWHIIPYFANVLATIPKIKELKGVSRIEVFSRLKGDLSTAFFLLNTLIHKAVSLGIFDTKAPEPGHIPKHAHCCPRLSFPLYHFRIPAAGILRAMLLSMQNYLLILLYAPIREAEGRIELLESERKNIESRAFEICHTFAAVEDGFGGDGRAYFMLFQSLVMVGFSRCQKDLRLWLWHKLGHLERLGGGDIEQIKKNLAVVWHVPELLTGGFDVWTLERRRQDFIRAEDIGLAAEVCQLSPQREEEENCVLED